MGTLSELPNIGKNNEAQLNQVGIYTAEQLAEVGSKQAWLKIKAIDESACINRLYALEGAIQNMKKSDLPSEKKEELKDFYNHFK
jgi:DNA transformation protein